MFLLTGKKVCGKTGSCCPVDTKGRARLRPVYIRPSKSSVYFTFCELVSFSKNQRKIEFFPFSNLGHISNVPLLQRSLKVAESITKSGITFVSKLYYEKQPQNSLKY